MLSMHILGGREEERIKEKDFSLHLSGGEDGFFFCFVLIQLLMHCEVFSLPQIQLLLSY